MIWGTPEMIRRRVQQAVTRAMIAAMLALSTLPATAQQTEIPLSVNKQHLTVEVASTDAARMQGLMYRRMLPENRGMLFVFRDIALHGMWMMNTYVPLSVAFLDQRGAIINIEDMEPHTRTTHSAARPAKYALEVNRGWFAKRGIKPGMRVEGLERAPPAR
jgi:uncharacterized membrane protein (UPF0127 family)